MTARARFSVVELKRAVKAFEMAGLCVAGARINPMTGEITLLTPAGAPANDTDNPLERHLNG